MSVSDLVPYPPKTFLPRPGRPACRYRAPGPRGPALVDLVEPRTIAMGGPMGDACLFLALAAEHLSRVGNSVALAQRQSQRPLMTWVEDADALPPEQDPRPRPPGQARPPQLTTTSNAATSAAPSAGERFGALVLYDTPFAGSGLGVRLPSAALGAAARVWLCEVGPEPELFDPLDQLSDRALRDSFAWAHGRHERDLRTEADEVLGERHTRTPAAPQPIDASGRGIREARDRPDWDVSGAGFGRIRYHLDIAEVAGTRPER